MRPGFILLAMLAIFSSKVFADVEKASCLVLYKSHPNGKSFAQVVIVKLNSSEDGSDLVGTEKFYVSADGFSRSGQVSVSYTTAKAGIDTVSISFWPFEGKANGSTNISISNKEGNTSDVLEVSSLRF